MVEGRQRGCSHSSTADQFASYSGTAPLDASSGDQIRHRLNTGGNRQLNCALRTPSPCAKPVIPAAGASTTSGKSPRTKPLPKPAAHSNDACPT
ncbi:MULTISPECIES: transposase [Nonomuraea]|uniref:Transposase n=1 Tax=Nonomuraea mangrovi TaxID=2316207 RepID=A0ABW4SXZ9_9ACTN